MFRYLIGLLFLMAIVGVAYYFLGMQSATSPELAKKMEPLIIGFVGPLSGNAASYGASIKNSVSLAIKDLKTQGKPVDVIYEDGRCDSQSAVEALKRLIDKGIKIVIGGVCSGETLAMAPIAEENRIILFSPAAASPDITNAGTFVFRNNPSDAYGGKVLSDFLSKKHKEVAIIFENADYPKVLRNIFIENFTEKGGRITLDEAFTSDAKEFTQIISKVKNATTVEAIVINPQTEQLAGQLVKDIRGAKIDLPIYGHLLPGGDRFLEVAGKAAEGLIFTDVPSLNESNVRVSTFLEDYRKNFGQPVMEFYMGAAYDAVNLLVQAVERIGSDQLRVKDYLYNLPEFDGLLGKYSFDLNGDVLSINLVLKIIKEGRVVNYEETEVIENSTSTLENSTSTATTTQKSI